MEAFIVYDVVVFLLSLKTWANEYVRRIRDMKTAGIAEKTADMSCWGLISVNLSVEVDDTAEVDH